MFLTRYLRIKIGADFQKWRHKLDVVLRLEHKAGEKLFVDWAGQTISVHDRITGLVWQSPRLLPNT